MKKKMKIAMSANIPLASTCRRFRSKDHALVIIIKPCLNDYLPRRSLSPPGFLPQTSVKPAKLVYLLCTASTRIDHHASTLNIIRLQRQLSRPFLCTMMTTDALPATCVPIHGRLRCNSVSDAIRSYCQADSIPFLYMR